ncbi:PREDICTED: uncharacterized protein LOC109243495 [Nicotiana attenuata]|uniref:uncharacterized protein LOC109243495 n=1 Tax=Nicotiana attenuata TaxID=49451 RepID=UPI0009049A17|nr:PREDICTED: uncharacterized protein LOC109243495 [Nicotiana attenuata]
MEGANRTGQSSNEKGEMVEYFLQALEPTYFGHLISATGKSFKDVVKMGEMVEEGLKSSKIMSYSAIKATTQAIQSGTGSLLGKKKKDNVATVVFGPWHGQRAPQNTYPPPQPYQNPTGPNFRPRPEYKRERQQRKQTFTLLGESYTSLFQRLRQLDVLRPIESKIPNPPPKNLDYSLICAYCSDAPGHVIEKCWHLKRAIQELIGTNQIVVQSPDTPNINQNPLPAHAETHMIEIVHKDGKPEKPSKGGREAELLGLKPPVLVVKGPSKDIGASQENLKVVVPGVPNKPVIVVKGSPITPIVIKPVTQLPVVDNKAVPWNYKQVIVTYKGKEVEEEVNETGGLTRSGRCFAPEELRKAKPFKDSQMLIKKSVTEEEAEEFLKNMKLQDYFIVEQLRKTPAQISLLSLLTHLDENRRALMKILNEAYVPDKITVHHLKKIANKNFEVNRITFSDDELPMEGTEHNRALYRTCKYLPSVYSAKVEDRHQNNPYEQLSVEKIPEGKCILGPKLSSASVMVASEMLKNGFVPGKGLGLSLQGIVHPVRPRGNLGTFGLGFMPTGKDVKRVTNLKQKVWSLPEPVPHIPKFFVKPGAEKPLVSSVPKPVVDVDEELIKRF